VEGTKVWAIRSQLCCPNWVPEAWLLLPVQGEKGRQLHAHHKGQPGQQPLGWAIPEAPSYVFHLSFKYVHYEVPA
jgi:hypothetical protein